MRGPPPPGYVCWLLRPMNTIYPPKAQQLQYKTKLCAST